MASADSFQMFQKNARDQGVDKDINEPTVQCVDKDVHYILHDNQSMSLTSSCFLIIPCKVLHTMLENDCGSIEGRFDHLVPKISGSVVVFKSPKAFEILAFVTGFHFILRIGAHALY